MRRGRGFTLIELVMVIVILGILSAVAIPAFLNLQEDAKKAAVQGALGGFRSAFSIYYAKQAATSGVGTFPTLNEIKTTTNVMQGGRIPPNPYFSGGSAQYATTIIAGTTEGTSGVAGWIYNAATGEIYSAAPQTQGSGF